MELKPCPFCGGEADFRTENFGATVWVKCVICGVSTSRYDTNLIVCGKGGKDWAIEEWNKRVEIDPFKLVEIDHVRLVDVYKEGLIGDVHAIEECNPVDAVEVAELREFAEDVAYQFGYYCQNGGRLCITHGGLSTLERAFDILGWENPHPVPECECQIEGCHEHATCGIPTADGYKRVCGKHMAKMDGDGNG